MYANHGFSGPARLLPMLLGLGLAAGALAQDNPLVVAADVGFAPHAMARAEGGYEGFNVDMAEEIARRMGRDGAEIIDQEWSGIFAGLNAGKYEFIIAPTTMTTERAESLLFTEGYLDTDYTFLIRADDAEITGLEDLEGKIIAVNNGSAYDIWATENQEQYGFEIQRYGKNADAIQALLTNRADTNLAGNTVSGWAAKQNLRVKTSYTISTGRVFSIPFRQDDVETRDRVEAIVECMKLDGTYAELHEKWFGAPPPAGASSLTVSVGVGQPGYPGYDPTPHPVVCE